jgi:hypothetical protein
MKILKKYKSFLLNENEDNDPTVELHLRMIEGKFKLKRVNFNTFDHLLIQELVN